MKLHRGIMLVVVSVLSSVFLAGIGMAYHYHAYSYDSFAPPYYRTSLYDSTLYAPRYTYIPYREQYYYRNPSVYARTHDSLVYASDDFIYYRADMGVPRAQIRNMYFSPRYFPSLYEPW